MTTNSRMFNALSTASSPFALPNLLPPASPPKTPRPQMPLPSGAPFNPPSSFKPKKVVQQSSNLPSKTEDDDNDFWGLKGMVKGAAVKGAAYLFNQHVDEDRAVIRALVSDADQIFSLIDQEMPCLMSIAYKMASPKFASEAIIKGILLRIIGNLAVATKTKPLNSQELIEKSFYRLLDIIGPNLNDLDAGRANASYSLASSMIDLLLPQGDWIREWLDWLPDGVVATIKKTIGALIAEMYVPISGWLNGTPPLLQSNQNPLEIQEELEYLIPKYLNKACEYTLDKDKEFFQKLTKTNDDDLYLIVKKVSPQIHEQMKEHIPKAVSDLLHPKLIEKAIEAALMRGLGSLSAEIFADKLNNGIPISTDELIQMVTEHFSHEMNERFRDVQKLQRLNNGVVDIAHFYPACNYLMKLFLPKEQWIQSFIERRKAVIGKPIAEYYLAFYNATVNDQSEAEYKTRLITILRDTTDILNVDTGPLIDQLQDFIKKTVSFVRERGTEQLEDILKLLQYLQKNDKDKLSPELLSRIVSGVNKIAAGNNPEAILIADHLQHVLESLLFKGLVNALEKIDVQERIPLDQLLFKVFESLLQVGSTALNNIDGSGNEFIDFFFAENGKNLEDHLPLPKDAQDLIGEKIRVKSRNLFNSIASTLFNWIENRKDSEDDLERIFKSKNPLKICNLLQHVVVQGVPYFFRKNENEEADARKNYEMLTEDHIIPFLTPFLSDPSGHIPGMIQGFLREMGENPLPELHQLLTFIGKFVETAAIHLKLDLFSLIKEMEKCDTNNPASLLETIAYKVTDESAKHFGAIGATKEKIKKSQPTRAEYIHEFNHSNPKRNILHRALFDELPGAPSGDMNKKDFFGDITGKVLKILTGAPQGGLDNVDLFDVFTGEILKIFKMDEMGKTAVPDLIKMGVIDAVQNQAIPMALDYLCNTISDVDTINQILISILNQVVKDEHSPSVIDKLFPDNEANIIDLKDLDTKFVDKFQVDLQAKLGKAVEALIRMQPDRLPRLLIKHKILKETAAEAIGQAIRAQITDPKTNQPISMITILNGVMGSIVDNLAPSEWDPVAGRFIYEARSLEGVPKKDAATGKIKTTDTPNLGRYFPKADEVKQQKKFEKNQKIRAEKNVPKFLRKIINDQTDQIVIEAFIKWWNKREHHFHEWLIKTLGDVYGQKFSEVLIPITRWILKYPLAVVVLVFNYTIWLIASQILKLIFNKQAKNRLEDVKADIHDNAIYRGLEVVIDTFVDRLSTVPSQSDDEESSDLDFLDVIGSGSSNVDNVNNPVQDQDDESSEGDIIGEDPEVVFEKRSSD